MPPADPNRSQDSAICSFGIDGGHALGQIDQIGEKCQAVVSKRAMSRVVRHMYSSPGAWCNNAFRDPRTWRTAQRSSCSVMGRTISVSANEQHRNMMAVCLVRHLIPPPVMVESTCEE